MTTPTDDYVHQALVSADAPPRPACPGGVGRSVMRKAEVTCPDCLQLDTDRKARTEVHDAHAIPARDEPLPTTHGDLAAEIHDAESPHYLTEFERTALLCYLIGFTSDSDAAVNRVAAILARRPQVTAAALVAHLNLNAGFDASDQADADERSRAQEVDADQTAQAEANGHDEADRELCAKQDCGECGEQAEHGDVFQDRERDDWTAIKTGDAKARYFWNYQPGDEVRYAPGSTLEEVVHHYGPLTKVPTKTHDLTVRRLHGGTVISVESEADSYGVYLPPGAAQDLGRVLDLLTPAQIALLIDDLKGGEK